MNTNILTDKLTEVRDDLKISADDLKKVKDDIRQLADRLEDTRKGAEREVNRFVKQYDRKVQDIASKMPDSLRQRIARYPGAALVTALIVMFVAGILLRPGR